MVSNNLKHLRNLIGDKRCWDFSVSFEAASIRGHKYIDVQLRLCLRRKFLNVRGLGNPFHGSHTGEHIYDTVTEFSAGIIGAMAFKVDLNCYGLCKKQYGDVRGGAVTRFVSFPCDQHRRK